MSGPLIPYIKIPEIPLGSLPSPLNSIKPFGILVATGVYVGAIVALRRARQRHLDEAKMNSFILYVVGIGFIGAHVFDALFYTPDRLFKDWTYLFQFWAGLSSYGGFLGAIIGLVLFKYLKKESVIAYADTVCSAFPISWVFGRAGCSSVHDHLGKDTTSWLGVQYYNPRTHDPHAWGFIYDSGQTMGKFDLGFIEFALTIPLALTFIFLWRQKPRPYGFFPGWMSIAYAPVRFSLDFLRLEPGGAHEADPRYFGLTPAQWACFGLFALGIMLLRFSKQSAAPATWDALHEEARRREAEEEAADKAAADEVERLRAKRRRSEDEEAGAASLKSAPKKKKKKKKTAPSPEEAPEEVKVERSSERASEDDGTEASKEAEKPPLEASSEAEDLLENNGEKKPEPQASASRKKKTEAETDADAERAPSPDESPD